MMIKRLLIIIFLLLTTTVSVGEGVYVTIHLPKGISFDVPKNWILLSNNEKVDLAAFSEAIVDEEFGPGEEFEALHFAANYYNKEGKTEALVNLRYYPDNQLSQKDVKDESYNLVMGIIDIQNENIMHKVLNKAGLKVIEWKGARKEIIGGLTAIVTEYRRTGPYGNPGRVRLMMFNNGKDSFHMTVSYDDKKHNSFMLKAITNKIINSLKVDAY